MRIAEFTWHTVAVPLRREVKHASASRNESVNLLVSCRLTDGTLGWGEGVPRVYVTGETPDGAFDLLSATPLAEQLGGACHGWDEVFTLCEGFRPPAAGDDPRGCRGNALRCAVELSILDAFGRAFGEPLSAATERFLPAASVRRVSARVRYSGAITAEAHRAEALSALKMRLNRFAQCKVKVGMRGVDDVARLRRIRRIVGRGMDLRLDANEAWTAAEAASRIEPLLAFGVSSIEQPLPHAELAGMSALRRAVDVRFMLDESLTGLPDAERAIELGACDLFNIRLSKCGGYLNSLRLAARAKQAGLGYQLGCHPGETGILSAAGRHWASSVGGIAYLEGSFDRHLLKELPTHEDITFGFRGFAPALSGPGLGVTVRPDVLARMTLRMESRQIS